MLFVFMVVIYLLCWFYLFYEGPPEQTRETLSSAGKPRSPKSYPHPRLQGFPTWKRTPQDTGKERIAWRQESGGGDKFLAVGNPGVEAWRLGGLVEEVPCPLCAQRRGLSSKRRGPNPKNNSLRRKQCRKRRMESLICRCLFSY